MKLAEALAERAAIKRRLETLTERLVRNSTTYEDEQPAEDPKRLLEELNNITERYEYLVSRINTANANTVASNGETLAVLLARRETLIQKVAVLNKVANPPSTRSAWSSRTKDDVRTVPTVDVASLMAEADMLSKRARETDVLIQEANWSTVI